MARFLPPAHLSIAGSTATIHPPFLPPTLCPVIHLHPSPHSPNPRSHNYLFDPTSTTVYCLAAGLKGGGCFSSKVTDSSPPTFYDLPAQEKACDELSLAMVKSTDVEVGKCCNVLFDCEVSNLWLAAARKVAAAIKESRELWEWRATSGCSARILCARLLRMVAVRTKLAEVRERLSVREKDESEKQAEEMFAAIGKRLIALAKGKQQRNDVVLAELKASWGIVSGGGLLRNKEAESEMANFLLLFESSNVMKMSQSGVISTIFRFHKCVQATLEKSFSLQIVLLTAIDFAVKSPTVELISLLKTIIQASKQWATGVLAASILRKWLSFSLSSEAETECISLLKFLCSFQPFVHRSNWKLRGGALWSLLALHEQSKFTSFEPALRTIIATRKTMEKDTDVRHQASSMDSFRSAMAIPAGTQDYDLALEQEIIDLSVLISASKNHIYSERSSEDEIEKYQKGVKKQLTKALEAFEDLVEGYPQLQSQLQMIRELVNMLDSILTTKAKIKVDLSALDGKDDAKVITLPRMKQVEDCFFGRSAELFRLREMLGAIDQKNALAIIGEDSIGKSWLAIKYAQMYEREYDSVYYLQADSAGSLLCGLLSLGTQLHCERGSEKDTLEEVKMRIITQSRTLLIYDNAIFIDKSRPNNAEEIEEYLSLVFMTNGHVIVTSCDVTWGERMALLHLLPFAEEEAIELVEKVTKVGDRASVRELVKDLGYNPMAVKQTAYLIQRKKCSIPEFRSLFAPKLSSPLIPSILELCLSSLTPEAYQLMELISSSESSSISFHNISSMLKDKTEAGVTSVLSDLRSIEFIDINPQCVTVNKSFQRVARHFCTEKEALKLTVSAASTAQNQPQNGQLRGQIVPYLRREEGDREPADIIEKLELIYREHQPRLEELKAAEAKQSSPENVVESHVEAASQYFRSKQSAEAGIEFDKALIAAGDDKALKVKVKTVFGKLLMRYEKSDRGLQVLREADELSQGLEDVIPKDIADLSMNYAIALMEQHRDQEALQYYQKALKLHSNEQNSEEIVPILLNLAYFYQISSLKNFEEAEKLNLAAAELISNQSDPQNEVIFQNLAIIYSEKAKIDPSFLDKKLNFLQLAIQYRQKYLSRSKVDPATAQLYISLADVYIAKKDWGSAVEPLQLSLERLDLKDELYITAKRKHEAVVFNLSHPEVEVKSSVG